MKKINLKKIQGFTLIELLVVITIIGILATIVVVNLNTTRGRGQDVAVKEQMSQIRAASELYYDTEYGYSTSPITSVQTAPCSSVSSWTNTYFAESDLQKSVLGIQRNSSVAPTCYLGANASKAQSWAIVAKLRLGTAYWCVDSYGASQQIAANNAVNGTEAQCPAS